MAAGTTAWNRRTWKRAALRSTSITPTALNVLLYLEEEHSDWATGGNVWPACATIGEALGMTRQTVLGHMQKLERAGWIIQTRPATKRAPAHYRLSFGEHRPFGPSESPTSERSESPTSGQGERSESPTSEVGISDVERSESPTRTELLNGTSNSSSAPAAVESPESVGTTGEEEDEDRLFVKLMKLWPNPKARSKTARENARAEWDRLVTRPGFQAETILLHLRRDIESGTVSTSTWPDAWINATFDPATLQAEERKRAAEQRRTAIAECPHCDDHGFLEMPYERARAAGLWPTDFGTARCPHDNTAPDIIERMFANALARKEGAA